MSLRRAILPIVALLLICGPATAGGISDGLQTILDLTDETTPVKAMIFLSDQVDILSLDLELHHAKASRGVRHARVITELQDLASATQGDLLAALEAEKIAGRVVGYTPHWLVNGVVVVAIKAALYDLAQRSDVDIIEADLVPALIEPVSVDSVPAGTPLQGIGIAPGVVAVGARRVWDELGVRGEGALVGTLDSGVDGLHPALAARWRGKFPPWQHAWLDVFGDSTQFPTDGNYHGTHVTGTITGLALDDTIGVAPAAHWIACNAIAQGFGDEFDNDVLVALAWFADPDGDPMTVDDVPDVVQNSWGVNEHVAGYVACDSRWWDAIDACEAAGVVLIWSAGNEGPNSMTMRSPADRTTTRYNTFSVGSTVKSPPYTISRLSSRGPSSPDCDAVENRIKPEIVAPGNNIYSSFPDSGYAYLSGTSMAGPHIAGVVALMRSANPDLDVITIKQILMDTAIDLGDPGEDNTYGHGFVDAYTAVLMAMYDISSLPVIYTDRSEETGLDYTGLPRNAAVIDIDNDGNKDLLITRVAGDGDGLAYLCDHHTENGVPFFLPYTNDAFSGTPRPADGTHGLLVADFDNDGHVDFYATGHAAGTQRLYRNTGGTFVDVTAAAGLDDVPPGAVSAAWADYDGDGYLDLLILVDVAVTPPIPNQVRLYRNSPKAGGGREFTDVTAAADLDGAGSYSLTPLWADLDRDGHLDLVLLRADSALGSHRYFVNQGDGTFVDQTQQRMPGIDELTAVAGLAALADIDGDGYLDIVFANTAGYQAGYLLNDGWGNFPAAKARTFMMGAFDTARDLDVLDFDLDGRVDVLVTIGGGRTRLLANRVLQTEPELIDVTQAAGLGTIAALSSAVPADFNLDGFTDLYLGRRVQDGHYFYKAGEGAAAQNNWVGIRLSAPHGTCNLHGIGATVWIIAGDLTLARVVDGGSGWAGQQEAGLVFGLGDWTGPVTAKVIWPSGRWQTTTVQANLYTTIVDEPLPEIIESTVQAYLVYHVATGEQDWVFEWETTKYSQARLDKVTILTNKLPARCEPEFIALTPDMPEVENTVASMTSGTWRHQLTWRNVQCEPNCSIPFEVHSGVGQYQTKSEDPHKLNIPACPQSN